MKRQNTLLSFLTKTNKDSCSNNQSKKSKKETEIEVRDKQPSSKDYCVFYIKYYLLIKGSITTRKRKNFSI